MQIMQEEIFAPIVPVVTYKNIDEVIAAHLGPWQTAGALHLQQRPEATSTRYSAEHHRAA